MLEAIFVTLRETWSGYVESLRLVIPRLLAMLSVVVAGWLVASVARAVVRAALGWLRVARLAERAGAAELLRKAELPPADRLGAAAAFWIVLLGFLLAGVDALGFRTLQSVRAEAAQILPRLLGAALVVGVGLVLANLVFRMVLLAALNAGWPAARPAARGVHLLALTIVAAMALDHLGLARPIVLTAFALVVGGVVLAVAIAVGVGAGPFVRRLLEDRLPPRAGAEPDGSAHL